MKPLIAALVFLVAATTCSCTVYLKDAIRGTPYRRTYDETYKNAIAEGVNKDEAHRRALLAGGSYHNEESARRKREKKEDRKRARLEGRDPSDDWIDVKWD